MNDFEFLFALFGLLLGFTLVEVLKGLVETLKWASPLHNPAATRVRLGWLTPLLGLFVLLDATSWWVNLWEVRHFLRVGFDTAFAILLLASVYYFAAPWSFRETRTNGLISMPGSGSTDGKCSSRSLFPTWSARSSRQST